MRVLRWPLHWPGCPAGADVTDWRDDGGGNAEKLFAIVEKLPIWEPPADQAQQQTDEAADQEATEASPPPKKRMILSSRDFVASFVPPEYVIDGILQRRFIYSLTGQIGAGKTAVLLLFAACVATARKLGNRTVEKGRVLYLAGENPTDHQMRWIAMSQQLGFDAADIDVYFIPGRFNIAELKEQVRAEIETIGEMTLIVVDTSAAYFAGENENDSKQAGDHAVLLRSLTEMPGGPCVVVACHPVKNASEDNLQPRGAGAFIAEVDGNLTAKKSDGATEMHWQSKFRGPDFAPISFQLRTVTHERLKTVTGTLLPTVVASYLSDAAQQEIERAQRSQEDALLKAIAERPTASQAGLLRRLDGSCATAPSTRSASSASNRRWRKAS